MKSIKLTIILVIITFISTSLFSQENPKAQRISREVKVGDRVYLVGSIGKNRVNFCTKENEALQHNVFWDGSPRYDKNKTDKLADILCETLRAKGKKLTTRICSFILIVDSTGKIIDVELFLFADCVSFDKISDKVCFDIEDYIEIEKRVKSEINLGPFYKIPEEDKDKYFYYDLTSIKETVYE